MQSSLKVHPGQQSSYYHCQPESISAPEPGFEPMQIDNTRLAPAEQQRRLTQGLRLYCSAGGHVIFACSAHPLLPVVSFVHTPAVNLKPLTVVMLTASNISISIHALPDSGSARNFISGSLYHQLNHPRIATKTTYKVQSVTGKPLCMYASVLVPSTSTFANCTLSHSISCFWSTPPLI